MTDFPVIEISRADYYILIVLAWGIVLALLLIFLGGAKE